MGHSFGHLTCPICGNALGRGPTDCGQCELARKWEREPDEKPKDKQLWRRQLNDGTYLVWWEGTNEHLNHWHVAPDGTVLSVKEGGDYRYNRADIRKRISEVTGLKWEAGWR
jgi:hypothetical protein